ncbi:ComEC/Rec2 family competence protein [Maribacter sp. X9]|uniref:ComEC/Rec2 family competence protein n=1 Tax=Maribacter sp. X9 TaxID=3402159 RepID=UPI003AF3EDDF
MKLLAFIPIKLTLLLILGILIGWVFPFEPTFLLIITVGLFLVLATIYWLEKKTRPIIFGPIAALTVIALGAYSYSAAQPKNHHTHYSRLEPEQTRLWNLKVREVLKPNSFSNRYLATVKSINGLPVTGPILINSGLDSTSQILKVDDEILVYANLQPIRPPLNPYQFDYKTYLENLGVYHQLRIEPHRFIVTDHPQKTVIGIAANARNYIIKKLKQADFGVDELGVIQALLLGQRSDISQETYSNYQKAGAVHILAVSGLHIGILLVLIQFILRPIKYIPKGRIVTLILTVALIWGFAFLAGLSASIIRATTMFTFVAYALYLNRPSNSFNILALSVLFILLFINPYLLFQVGFQMSYAAVFAILWIYPLLQKVWFPNNRIVRYFWQLLCVSIAAQLGVLPISLFYFHQFPGLFFISNLIIIPVLGIILGVGILVIFLAVLNWLPSPLVWIYNEIMGLINRLIGWVAEQENFIFQSVPFDFGQLLLSFLVLFLFINALMKFTYKPIAYFLIGLICFQGWTIYQEIESAGKKEVVILHQTKNSIVLIRNGKELSVLTNTKNKLNNLFQAYQIGERIEHITYDPLYNSYSTPNSSFVILDSTGIYPSNVLNSRILLTQSPKINLERLIHLARPTEVIADGSNYTSYITRWKLTCLKNKIPFHYTGEKGAYYFK